MGRTGRGRGPLSFWSAGAGDPQRGGRGRAQGWRGSPRWQRGSKALGRVGVQQGGREDSGAGGGWQGNSGSPELGSGWGALGCGGKGTRSESRPPSIILKTTHQTSSQHKPPCPLLPSTTSCHVPRPPPWPTGPLSPSRPLAPPPVSLFWPHASHPSSSRQPPCGTPAPGTSRPCSFVSSK